MQVGDYVQLREGWIHRGLHHGTKYCIVDIEAVTNFVDLFYPDAGQAAVNVPLECLELADDPFRKTEEYVSKLGFLPDIDTDETTYHTYYSEKESALQGGTGRGYKDLPVQPIELSMANGLNACQHTAIKYLMGYNLEGGKGLADLVKAKHTIDILMELMEG
jgi:hypothetical protein